jgi:hypothetical protein
MHAAQEKKAFKVSKGESIGDLIGRMCSKFDVLALEQDTLQLVLASGKVLKNHKSVHDYRLHDNVWLLKGSVCACDGVPKA